jgi:hypothetical protein
VKGSSGAEVKAAVVWVAEAWAVEGREKAARAVAETVAAP